MSVLRLVLTFLRKPSTGCGEGKSKSSFSSSTCMKSIGFYNLEISTLRFGDCVRRIFSGLFLLLSKLFGIDPLFWGLGLFILKCPLLFSESCADICLKIASKGVFYLECSLGSEIRWFIESSRSSNYFGIVRLIIFDIPSFSLFLALNENCLNDSSNWSISSPAVFFRYRSSSSLLKRPTLSLSLSLIC